jgi:CRP-like cAMP-binding protein
MPSADGETVQVAAVGAEGIVTPTVLSEPVARYEAIVALASDVLRIDADRLRRLSERSPSLQRLLLEQTQALLVQVSHAAACHRFHTVGQRLARLLLTLRDRAERDGLEVTHDFLARLLGTPRSGVSMAIGAFERSDVVRCRRGRLTILRPRAIEQQACDCYQLLREEFLAKPVTPMKP